MYNVLIVDDELLIRSSIQSMLCRMENPQIGETRCCANAEEALAMCGCFTPDIVITDIVMGELNGIELLTLLHERFQNCRFLVVSGYDDYDFIRQSFTGGATDYLLKPILYSAFKKAIDKLCDELSCQRRSTLDKAFSAYLRDLATHQFAPGYEPRLSVLPEDTKVQVVACDCEGAPEIETVRQLISQKASLAGELKQATLGMANGLYYALDVNPPQGIERKLAEWAMQSSKRLVFAVSDLCPAASLAAQIRTVRDLLSHRLTNPQQSVFTVRDIHAVDRQGIAAELNTLFDKMLPENTDTIKKQLHELFEGYDADSMRSAYHLVVNLCSVRSWQTPDESPLQVVQPFHRFTTLDELLRQIDQYIDLSAKRQSGYGTDMISLVRKYIEENCHRKLMLSEVADHFAVSYAHMSHLISKSLCMPFSEYVTSLRMQHALECLKDPTRSIQEIADSLGFENQFTFSRTFKKYFGVSPNHLRKEHKNE